MAFQVEDIADLLRLIHEHPEWRDQLRAAILPGEVLNLPQSIAELVEAQKRFQETLEAHDQRLERLEQTVAELVEAQKRFQETLEAHDQRLERLEQTVAELVETQKRFQETLEAHDQRLERLEQTVTELVEAQKRFQQTLEAHDRRLEAHNQRLERLEQTVAELAEVVRNLVRTVEKMENRLAKVSGFYYEYDYRQRAPSYFTRLLRRTRGLVPQDIDELVEPYLSDEELADFYRTDVIVRGRWKQDGEFVYFAMEVSETVEANDVARALQRTELLRKAGLRAVPAVAGSDATKEARFMAGREGVLLVTDGVMENLEAVQQYLSASA